MEKILLVEDDSNIIKTLLIGLPAYGLNPTTTSSVLSAKELIIKTEYELVILDINLPDGSGFELCEYIRKLNSTIPILILTSETDEKSAVKGFSFGADDYVRKPFGIEELVSRIKRLLSKSVKRQEFLIYKSIKLDVSNATVLIKGMDINLTKTELKILELLIRKSEQIVSRDQFLDFVDDEGKIFDRSIDSYVSRLRNKLNKADNIDFEIKAIYGIGYRLGEK